MRASLAIALAFALALGGCIQNVRDRMSGGGANANDTLQGASVAPTTTPDGAAANASTLKPPVARITVFGAGGALVLKSSFVADNVTTPVIVNAGDNLTFMASDSEAQVGTLASYAWDLAGKTASGSRAAASWSEPGVYPVRLTVTDSQGLWDEQVVVLGVAPPTFDITKNQTSAALAGASTVGSAAPSGEVSVKFDVSIEHAGKPAMLVGVKLATVAVDTCDVDVEVANKDGNVVGKSASGGVGAPEAIDLGRLPVGSYTAKLTAGDACVAKDGVTVSVTETFLPLVNGMMLMAGHAM